MLVDKDLYALVINLITLSHQNQIKALGYLMKNKQLKLTDTEVGKKFHLNIKDREMKPIDIGELD